MIKKFFQTLFSELEVRRQDRQLVQGWVSGALALALAFIACVTILCFIAPNVFTLAQIRAVIHITYIRITLQVILIVAFLLACVSLILRQSKVLGLSAVVLVFLSLAFGGSNASALTTAKSPTYFAFDWFIINLTLTGLVFIPFERLFYRVDQSIYRFEWREDLLYFLISSVMVQGLSFLSFLPSREISALIDFSYIVHFISRQPVLLQLLEIMFLTDLVQYWFHRMMHRVPFLWNFHAIHHSAKAMDWLAASRMHVIEIIFLRAITVIPMQTLGFSHGAIYAYLIIVFLYSTYIHSNVSFDIEPLKPIIVTPRFHHWHHGMEKEAIDVNFAIHFPILDKLFGTYHMPKNRWPESYGIRKKIPSGFIKQFFYPLKKQK